jgi:ubiquinone/menaquinone biosynthesis C-methylase UbiE
MFVAAHELMSHFYAPGHSARELDRLSLQGANVRAIYTTAVPRSRPASGNAWLDVGCGSGDVALLASELVGPTGAVVGIDRAAAAIVRAKARAESQRMSNVQFVEGDPTLIRVDDGFDAIVGRLILMYYPDPN